MEAEIALGYEPEDVSGESRGYDIESRVLDTKKLEKERLRFIEVKGRAAEAKTVTITKNEILTGLNKPDEFILAIVLVHEDSAITRYCRKPFSKEPDFGVESINYALNDLLISATEPN